MICGPCAGGSHDRCEDVVRREAFADWIRATFAGVAVGAEEHALIAANTPYDSCSCQHKGAADREEVGVRAAVPVAVI